MRTLALWAGIATAVAGFIVSAAADRGIGAALIVVGAIVATVGGGYGRS